MKSHVIIVLHDLSLTGAPKLGIEIAKLLQANFRVSIISKKTGILSAEVDNTKFENFIVTNTSHEISKLELEDRIKSSASLLKKLNGDLIIINSAASADFLPAANFLKIPSILFIHEMLNELNSLINSKIINHKCLLFANCIFFASLESEMDFRKIIKNKFDAINFGIGLDCEKIISKSKLHNYNVYNELKEEVIFDSLQNNKNQLLIGMCGTASYRKGSDIFWNLAKTHPNMNFIWIGSWNDIENKIDNPALILNSKNPLPNLFWTNTRLNPYPILKSCNLVILTSREDPNPLIVAESLLLNVPVLSFNDTGGSYLWTSKHSFAMSGPIDEKRISKFLINFDNEKTTKVNNIKYLINNINLKSKIKIFIDKIEQLISIKRDNFSIDIENK
jgi:hypothetical protein